MNTKTKAEKKEDLNYFELWKCYEDITMHFNDLLIKIRTQALAVLVTITTGSSFVFGMKENIENVYVVTVLFSILVAWGSIFLLDIFYYKPLLDGAVKAILELEKTKFDDADKTLNIKLSTYIKESAASSCLKKFSRILFYLLPALMLCALIFYHLCFNVK